MTLLITLVAAVICTVIWYVKPQSSSYKVGVLLALYWGASLMWTVDAVFEYAELKADYFTPAAADMLNDAFLGLSAVALGLLLWLAILLIKDPTGRVKAILKKEK